MQNINLIKDVDLKKILNTPCSINGYSVKFYKDSHIREEDFTAKFLGVKVERDLDDNMAGTESCFGKIANVIAFLYSQMPDRGEEFGDKFTMDLKDEDLPAFVKLITWIDEDRNLSKFAMSVLNSKFGKRVMDYIDSDQH